MAPRRTTVALSSMICERILPGTSGCMMACSSLTRDSLGAFAETGGKQMAEQVSAGINTFQWHRPTISAQPLRPTVRPNIYTVNRPSRRDPRAPARTRRLGISLPCARSRQKRHALHETIGEPRVELAQRCIASRTDHAPRQAAMAQNRTQRIAGRARPSRDRNASLGQMLP